MAKTAYAVRPSVRVNGVTYRSPTEAFVAADEVEHDAQARADQYRRNGDEGLADKAVDRGREQAEQLRTWARMREEFEAREATQPANVPNEPVQGSTRNGHKKTSSPSKGKGARTPAPRARARGAGRTSGARSFASRGYTRSGARAQVYAATGFGWTVAGATIGIALLTLFLSKRGSVAFADLTTAAATALRVVVDPVDPLRPHLLDDYVAQAQAANLPAAPLPPPSAARGRAAASTLGWRRAPTNRRSGSLV